MNFFIETSKNKTSSESKQSNLTKYLAAGSAALASVGFTSFKVAESLRKYEYLKQLLKNKDFLQTTMINNHYKQNFFKNISNGLTINARNSSVINQGQFYGAQLDRLKIDSIGQNFYDIRNVSNNQIKLATDAFYSGNLEQSAEILQQNGVTVGKSFGFIDEIAIDFNTKMTSFRWFNTLITKLGSVFGDKYASFSAYAITGVILIILIVCLYYLFKFLYKKYRAWRLKR